MLNKLSWRITAHRAVEFDMVHGLVTRLQDLEFAFMGVCDFRDWRLLKRVPQLTCIDRVAHGKEALPLPGHHIKLPVLLSGTSFLWLAIYQFSFFDRRKFLV